MIFSLVYIMRKLFLTAILILPAACGGAVPDFEGYVAERLEARRGEPTLFYVDGIAHAAPTFRDELYYERKHLKGEFEPPLPSELDRRLQNYIEESILLEEALATVDLNSPDAQRYLWAFLRRGLIAYYLARESGAYELAQNYEQIEVPDEVVEKVIAERFAKAGADDAELAALREQVRGTAVFLKWKKLNAQAEQAKRELIGRLKQRRKVRLVPKEMYQVP